MSEFHQVATKSEIELGGMLLAECDDQLVILFRVDEDTFYCLDDVCTHDGGTLSDGSFEGCEIKCPRHGATFDVKTGTATGMPATKPTASHEVKVDGDNILVKLSE